MTAIRRRPFRRLLNLERFEERLTPATYVVDNLTFNGVGNSLRALINTANNNPGADTITFQAGLTGTITTNVADDMDINGPLTIIGPGPGVITVNGNGLSRLFDTSASPAGTAISISGLTITGGRAKFTAPGLASDSSGVGGAIYIEDENVTITNCRITGSTADKSGGGIAVAEHRYLGFGASANLNVNSSTISGNTASQGSGGGISVYGESFGPYASRFQSLFVTESTISGNVCNWSADMTSYRGGGGVYFRGKVGAGYFAFINSTVTNNKVTNGAVGGAVFAQELQGTITFVNSTVAYNQSDRGGACGVNIHHNFNFSPPPGNIIAFSSIFANNTQIGGTNHRDLSSRWESVLAGDNNLIGIADKGAITIQGNNNLTGTLAAPLDSKLGPLQDNGGPNPTRMPLATSPVISKGTLYLPAVPLTNDGRGAGYPRNLDGSIDIGAVEYTDWVVRTNSEKGSGTLYQRILDANAFVAEQTITFDPVTFPTNKSTNVLVPINTPIGDSLTISGPGAAVVTLQRSGPNGRMFDVGSASFGDVITMSGLTITGGVSDNGGIIRAKDQTLNFTDCVFNGNTAKFGGAIFFDTTTAGELNLMRCTFTNNIADLAGGAVFFAGGGTFTITDSTFSGNQTKSGTTTSHGGGAVGFVGTATAPLLVRQSTFANNSAVGLGGGIFLSLFNGMLNVQNSTIAYNSATLTQGGGGIARFGGLGELTLDSTIVSNNTHTTGTNEDIYWAGNVWGNFSAVGIPGVTSILADATTASLFGQDFKLGTLAKNGGATQTILPAGDSPVRDRGSNLGALTVDQRGQNRLWNARADIGAVELPPIYVVRNNNDGGQDSLRQQILDANAVAGAATVTFDSSFFSSEKTIVMGGAAMAITENLTITGPGATLATVNASALSGIFSINNGLAVGISGMTLTNAKNASAITAGNGTLALNGMVVTGNSASFRAPVWVAGGSLNATDSQFTNNTGIDGGAIAVEPAGSLILTRTTVSGNSSSNSGGGVYAAGVVSIASSTIANNSLLNSAGAGGGLALNLNAQSTISNSTISGNQVNSNNPGGGIALLFGSGLLAIENSTITNNSTFGLGGGIGRANGGSTIAAVSSIISGNSAVGGGLDISTSGTANLTDCLLGSSSGIAAPIFSGTTASLLGQSAKLAPLADNGGPTLTHFPLPGSPIIDSGSNLAGLTLDQRGQARVFGSKIDIGAVEGFNLLVTNTSDSGSGSLRQTVQHANLLAGANTITFDPAVFSTSQTITLTTGELALTDAVTITGPGAKFTAISGNKAGRIFNATAAASGTSVTMSGLTLTNGAAATQSGGAIVADDQILNLNDCVFSGNSAANGGAIGFDPTTTGRLNLNRSTLSGNSASLSGGAICFYLGGRFRIENSTFSGNQSKGTNVINGGGAIYFYGTTTQAEVRNSTISGNTSARHGGGIGLRNFGGNLYLINSTIVYNSAAGTQGGGGIAQSSGTGSMLISSSIISNNTHIGGSNVDLFSAGFINADSCAIGSKTGATNFLGSATTNALLGQNFLLAPLANNGGSTSTHALLPGSHAINKGTNNLSFTSDQRGAGFVRNFGGTPDIGAFESQSINLVVTTTNDVNNGDYTAGDLSLREAVALANQLIGPDSITFDPTIFATPQTISLSSGKLSITDSVTINGSGAALVTLLGVNAQILDTRSAPLGTNLTVSGLTLQGGFANGGPGGAVAADEQSLNFLDCVFTGNNADAPGGAIALLGSGGLLNVQRCTFVNNTAGNTGGAIAIFSNNAFTIENSAFVGNQADAGGAIYVVGTVPTAVIRNTTMSGNKATTGPGGAILCENPSTNLNVQNSTIVNNQAAGSSTIGGGGIARTFGAGSIVLESTVIAGNQHTTGSNADLFTTGTVDAKFSAIGSKTGVANLVADATTTTLLGQDFKLAPLANNGGPTQTHALLFGSPLVNAGSNPMALTTDQRGFARISGVQTDIGAFEQTFLRVSLTNDIDNGDYSPNDLSLREAVKVANQTPGADTITFSPTVFASPQTIKLAAALSITAGLTVEASGVGRVTLSGNGVNIKIVNTTTAPAGTDITMTGLTFTAVKALNFGGAVLASNQVLTFNDCVFTGNSAMRGAAIHIESTDPVTRLNINRSTLSGNTATNTVDGSGGAIFFYGPGGFTIDSTTLSGNTAFGASTFDAGGGLFFSGTASVAIIRNSTISGNQVAENGGGIGLGTFNGNLLVQNSTIVNNYSAGSIGGGGISRFGGTGTITISSSIVANNIHATGASEDLATFGDVSATFSAITTTTGLNGKFTADATTNALLGQDFKLGTLANNGGPTQTIALLPGSPLINMGSNPATLTNDQRGANYLRVANGQIDIGAFELQTAKVTAVQVNDGSAQRSRVTSLMVTFDQLPPLPANPADAFQLKRQSDNAVVTLGASAAGNSVTLTFTGGAVESSSLADGKYTLTILAAQVPILDGNADGAPGDNYVLVGNPAVAPKLFRLFGDADGDSDVDTSDFGAFRAAFGGSNPIFDFDNDGDVDTSDFGQFRARFGMTI